MQRRFVIGAPLSGATLIERATFGSWVPADRIGIVLRRRSAAVPQNKKLRPTTPMALEIATEAALTVST